MVCLGELLCSPALTEMWPKVATNVIPAVFSGVASRHVNIRTAATDVVEKVLSMIGKANPYPCLACVIAATQIENNCLAVYINLCGKYHCVYAVDCFDWRMVHNHDLKLV